MDINKLAILTNALGGYDEAENALDVPADLIQKAIEGDILSGYEDALLDKGFSNLYLQDDRGLDLDGLFGTRADRFGYATDEGTTTGQLNLALQFLDRTELQNDFRTLVADGSVDISDLENGYGLFADLTTFQAETALEGIRSGRASASDMFNAYVSDDYRLSDVQDSEFWAWFRATFYPE